MRVALYTLGCKVNSYETDRIREGFEKIGAQIVSFTEPADVYVVNTCTVTQMAAKKSRQILHRARRLAPSALIIAAGCYAENDSAELPEGMVDFFVGNQEKENIPQLVLEAMASRPELEGEFESSQQEDGHTRAFLKVQDGCRQYCSYCIIPYVRGPLVSKEPGEALDEAKEMADKGYREVVLTGIHLSSYGRKGTMTDPEAESSLGQLITAMNEIPGLERIRLGSLEPGLITEQYVAEVAEADKLCPHYHLSMQSGCERTLRSMNRHYTPQEYLAAVELLRSKWPAVAITTDMIVGFPGETDEDFEESLAFLGKVGFSQVHVFKYSKRAGTVAARRPSQVSEQVKNERSERAIAYALELSEKFARQFVGSQRQVLLERPCAGGWEGYTDHYIRTVVKVSDQDALQANQIVQVQLQDCLQQAGEIYLTGVIV
ncbi:MAG: tRNA (N(6)-L-threonylcarbamoyladenosine(37)-C(2))-methylthiotransferase MtaB [Firmicutes bacterium]|nr:tRNA (N(6)-L-threonylcarbamoyladenosine(37)-C(2))-methylthiotransferase MtaB [Bacillota bacterium]